MSEDNKTNTPADKPAVDNKPAVETPATGQEAAASQPAPKTQAAPTPNTPDASGIELGPVQETASAKAAGEGKKVVEEGSKVLEEGVAGSAKTGEEAVTKSGKGMLAFAGGIKTGIAETWGAGKMGKAKVAVGVAMGAHGAFNFVRHTAQMFSSERGLDKNGEPLPKPGLLNLAFDAGEVGLGTALAAGKIFGGRGVA
jgi:hypothetical protein